MIVTHRTSARLGIGTRIYYGVGSVAFGVKDNGFSYFLQFFYSQVVGLPSATVGLAIMVALIVDAFVDPVIGQISDNWKSRWGRRHPLMYAAALPVALSYLLLWNPPLHWSHAALVGYLVGTSILVRSFISVYEIPSSALAAELTTDYDERTQLLSYRYLFGWAGGLTMYALAMLVFLKPHGGTVGQFDLAGYRHYGLAAAVLMLVAILVSAAGTHRFIPMLGRPPERTTRTPMAREIIETLAHRTFLFVLAASFFSAMALGLGFSINLYFSTYFWAFSTGQIALLATSGMIAAVIGFVAAPAVSARWDKKPVTIALIVGSTIFTVAPILCRLAHLLPANGSAALYWSVFAASVLALGSGITGQILLTSMIADVVEDAELRTGRRQEGLFFAAAAFVAKAVTGAGIFATSAIIAVIGFPAGAAPGRVSISVLRDLGVVYVLAAATLYLASAALLLGYRITRRSHAATLTRLAERQAGADLSFRPVAAE